MAITAGDDHNLRELSYANQKEEAPRIPTSENKLSEEESAALASRGGAVERALQLLSYQPTRT